MLGKRIIKILIPLRILVDYFHIVTSHKTKLRKYLAAVLMKYVMRIIIINNNNISIDEVQLG